LGQTLAIAKINNYQFTIRAMEFAQARFSTNFTTMVKAKQAFNLKELKNLTPYWVAVI